MPVVLQCRAGTTLAEMAVALVLSGLAAAAGAGLLVAAERRARADAAGDHAAQVARDIAAMLGGDVAAARDGSLLVLGDTAIELDSHVGGSVACTIVGADLVLPGATSSTGLPFTAWRQPPEPDDMVAAWDGAGGGWVAATITSAGFPSNGGGCAVGAFRTPADSVSRVPVTRLRLDRALPAGVARGAPVRVFRRVRWALYRGGDGAWWLGLRKCPGGVCGAAQPVTGPLAAPRDSGLVATLDSTSGLRVSHRTMTAGGAAPPERRAFAVRGSRRAPR
jgi:hypothetical protein